MKPYRPLRTLFFLAAASMIALSSSNLAITVAGMMGALDEDALSMTGALLAVGLGGGVIISLITGAVFFGMWMNRAAHNVRALGHTGFEISPAFGVGSFYIPIMNLWKPYQAMQDIWRASLANRNDSWLSTPSGDLVKGWWAAWLVAGFAGRISGASENFTGVDVVVSLVLFVAAALCIMMMHAIATGQEAQHAQATQNVSVGEAVSHTPIARL
jgi:hypothetical protein